MFDSNRNFLRDLCALIFAISTMFVATLSFAADFTGKTLRYGQASVGEIVDCVAPPATLVSQIAPTAFAWAISKGYAERSAVTGSPTYTKKGTSTNPLGQPTLFIGCWIATEIIKEKVDNQVRSFAKAKFVVNDPVRDSPFAGLNFCKKGSALYQIGDYQLIPEGDTMVCPNVQSQVRLSGIRELEKENILVGILNWGKNDARFNLVW